MAHYLAYRIYHNITETLYVITPRLTESITINTKMSYNIFICHNTIIQVIVNTTENLSMCRKTIFACITKYYIKQSRS